MSAVEAWRRGVMDVAKHLSGLADASERDGLADRAEVFRLAAMHAKLVVLHPPADLRAADDDGWNPENFAPLVGGVDYRPG